VDDWEDKPDADHTVDNMMAHFTRADDNRRDWEQGMKGAVSAIQNGVATDGPMEIVLVLVEYIQLQT
jgi:hypothetical protein